MSDVAKLFDGVRNRHTTTVHLAPDPDAVSAAELAAKSLSADVEGSLADRPPHSSTLSDLQDAVRESSFKFVVGGVGRTVWDALVLAHPATTEQQEQAEADGRGRYRWNPFTFARAAIAASLRSFTNPDGDSIDFDPPRMVGDGTAVDLDPRAVETVDLVWENFPLGETERLWAAVSNLTWDVAADRVASFGNGSRTTSSGAPRAD